MSSYRILPASDPKSAPAGPHDVLQNGPVSLAPPVKSNTDHLDSVCNPHLAPIFYLNLLQWDFTQDNLRLNLKRDVYGIHLPMRLLMERKLVSAVRFILFILFVNQCPIAEPTYVRPPSVKPTFRYSHGQRRGHRAC